MMRKYDEAEVVGRSEKMPADGTAESFKGDKLSNSSMKPSSELPDNCFRRRAGASSFSAIMGGDMSVSSSSIDMDSGDMTPDSVDTAPDEWRPRRCRRFWDDKRLEKQVKSRLP